MLYKCMFFEIKYIYLNFILGLSRKGVENYILLQI